MLYEAAAAWDASMAAWGASPATRRMRRSMLGTLERRGWGSIEQVTRRDIEAFLGTPSFKPGTRSTYFVTLSAFFTWAAESGLVETSPMKGVRRPRQPRTKPKPLTEDEVTKVLDSARGPMRAWLMLALYAGLRAHEIAKIDGVDVSEDNIFVSGKGGKEAYIPTHPLLWTLAQNYPRQGFWFPSTSVDGHVIPNVVSVQVGWHFRNNGIASGSIHRCRHTYATKLVRRGANIRTVQELMRHSSLATTQVYLEVTDADKTNAIGLLS
jgi:integrase/recombinase XerD